MSTVDLSITGTIDNGNSAPWWKDADGHYVNSTHVHELETVEAPAGNWKVRWYTQTRAGFFGPNFTTQADASDWAQELVDGVTPA